MTRITVLVVYLAVFVSCFQQQQAFAQQPLIRIAVVAHGNATNPSEIFSNHLSWPSQNLQTFFRGTHTWWSKINATGGIPTYDSNNTKVRIEIKYFNIGDTSQIARAQALAPKLTNGTYGNFSVLIAPGFSTDAIVSIFLLACEVSRTCLTVVPLTPSSSVFVCTDPLPADCKRAGSRRFQYGFSVLYDGNYALSAHLSLFRQSALTRVAIIYTSQPYGVQASQSTQDTAYSLGLNVVSTVQINITVALTPDYATSIVNQWQAEDIDVLCILGSTDPVVLASLQAIWQQFKAQNWLPRSIALGGSIGASLSTALGPADAAYLFTAAQWDWHLKGRQYSTVNSTFNLELFPATPTMASPAVFRDTMISLWGPITDANLVYATDAVQALTFIQKFVESANGAWDVESLRAVSRQISTPSINGQLQLDAYGRTVVSDQLVFQALPNGSRLINSPLSIGVPAILPMPQFDERQFSGTFFQSPVEQAAIALNTILFIYSTLLVLGFIVYRRHSVMKAATPLFCVLMIFGGQLMQASIYATGLYVTSASCNAQFWLLTCGFSLMFGALFMKTYRVWRIFNAGNKLKQVAISNNMLLTWLAGLMSFDLLLNIIASAADFFISDYVVVDDARPSRNYEQCSVADNARIYLVVTAAEKATMIFAGIVLTIAARNVPSRFNETPYLATAIYNSALICAFCVAIVATGIGGREVSYAVQVFGIQVLVFSNLSIVFVPKFYLMFGDAKRLKEMEKLNAEFTNGDSNTSKAAGWNPRTGGKRDPSAPVTVTPNQKNSSVHPHIPQSTKDAVQTTQTSTHRTSYGGQPARGTPNNAFKKDADPHYHNNAIHPYVPPETASNLEQSKDEEVVIHTATTQTLMAYNARLNARMESVTAMIERVQSEIEKRKLNRSDIPEQTRAPGSITAEGEPKQPGLSRLETSVSEVEAS